MAPTLDAKLFLIALSQKLQHLIAE